jgi:hypothetical protein
MTANTTIGTRTRTSTDGDRANKCSPRNRSIVRIEVLESDSVVVEDVNIKDGTSWSGVEKDIEGKRTRITF